MGVLKEKIRRILNFAVERVMGKQVIFRFAASN